MSYPADVLVSVRGEARRTVPPDRADIAGTTWRDVRSAAIEAAMAKGRDYAAALGGRLSAVEHIADPGLIGGEVQHWAGTSGRSVRFASSGGENPDAPELDPVPQELAALIEARFTATGISIAATQNPKSG